MAMSTGKHSQVWPYLPCVYIQVLIRHGHALALFVYYRYGHV